MSSPQAYRPPRPGTWSGCGIAVGTAALLHALPDLVHTGGAAALTVVGFAALGAGAPTALLQWSDEPAPVASATRIFAHATLLTTAAVMLATAAPWIPGPLGMLGATLPWLLLPALQQRRPSTAATSVAVVVACLALIAPFFMTAAPTATNGPWSLLTPRWGAWNTWGASALRTGLLMALVAPTWWHAGRRTPGSARVPWRAPGIGLLVMVLASVVAGFRYETLPAIVADASRLAVAPLALVALAATPMIRGPQPLDIRVDMAAGAVLTLVLSGPGAAAIPWWWSTVLPLSIAWTLGQQAYASQRWQLLPATALLAGAALAGFPGVPGEFIPAVLGTLCILAWLWLATLRSTLAEAT